MKLQAILWDYDGTLVNSVPKNIAITKSILSIVAPHLTGDKLPKYLLNEAAYHEANHSANNWQELYRDYYGLTEHEMLKAGSLWAEHQESNQTEVQLFDGIDKVIEQFSHLPHGICSQNSQLNIWNVLKQNGVDKSFRAVVGYDDLDSDCQKPHPFGGVKCLTDIFDEAINKLVMYVGDHEADVKFAKNVEQTLGTGSRVISVAAAYSGATPDSWSVKPDYVASCVPELASIIEKYT
ncbi:HAD family hydrolase [uncultured Shewanella sp.]|uniref:HAD family hydrolase n=1 Tax=Shewanella atlantica TaxID=271099 RepID=UPI00261B8509|nr:HAD hydrolase-like protein [uncultured Shewanella sp.]